MNKYSIDFKPFASRPGWYSSDDCLAGFSLYETQARSDAQEAQREMVKQIHQNNALGDTLVFQGDYGNSIPAAMYIFLIEGVTPADIALEFRVGSHQSKGEVKQCHKALKALYKVAPFSPTYIDTAGYHARFSPPITLEQAVKFLDVYEANEYPGLYPDEWMDLEQDEDNFDFSPDKLVREQKFMLWWD